MHIRNQLTTIDHHHGQASRTVVAGYPTIRGASMRDKASYYLKNLSWIHQSLIREPRGHRNMLGSILTEPVNEESSFGLLFLHADGLFDGCGDSTFCAAAAAVETGRVEVREPTTLFSVDTVNGPLHVEVDVNNGVVSEVRFENIPSYVVGKTFIDHATAGSIAVDVAFGGNYFGFIDASQFGLTIEPSSERAIIATANDLWSALDESKLPLDTHTGQPAKIELFTFVERMDQNHFKVANVYKPGRMGRTPSGTGTSAHVALRHANGDLDPGKVFLQESILGLRFTATVKPYVLPGGEPAVLPTIGAKSYLMGVHQFYIDGDDPYANGLMMEG
jgi:proline racemase